MKRKTYQHPVVNSLCLCEWRYLLAGSNGSTNRPTATFMSNPDIGEESDE